MPELMADRVTMRDFSRAVAAWTTTLEIPPRPETWMSVLAAILLQPLIPRLGYT